MAEMYYRSPRRVNVTITLHPAEVAEVISQPQLLQAMTIQELKKVADHVTAELSTRGEQDVIAETKSS